MVEAVETQLLLPLSMPNRARRKSRRWPSAANAVSCANESASMSPQPTPLPCRLTSRQAISPCKPQTVEQQDEQGEGQRRSRRTPRSQRIEGQRRKRINEDARGQRDDEPQGEVQLTTAAQADAAQVRWKSLPCLSSPFPSAEAVAAALQACRPDRARGCRGHCRRSCRAGHKPALAVKPVTETAERAVEPAAVVAVAAVEEAADVVTADPVVADVVVQADDAQPSAAVVAEPVMNEVVAEVEAAPPLPPSRWLSCSS